MFELSQPFISTPQTKLITGGGGGENEKIVFFFFKKRRNRIDKSFQIFLRTCSTTGEIQVTLILSRTSILYSYRKGEGAPAYQQSSGPAGTRNVLHLSKLIKSNQRPFSLHLSIDFLMQGIHSNAYTTKAIYLVMVM